MNPTIVEFIGKDSGATGAARAVEASMDRIGAKANTAGGAIGGFVGNLAKMAAVGGLAATAGIAGGFVLATQAAGDLQQAVANISTIKPEIDTSAVFAQLNELSTKVPQTAAQLGDALYDVFSSVNVSQAEGIALTEKFAKSAVGAQTDAKTFGTAAMGVMNAYGLAVSDADHISDVFFNTIAAGVVTGPELARGLGPITGSAKAAGVSLDVMGGLMVGVTKQGGDAAQNLNNLNNMLMKISTTDASTEMGKLGVETADASGKFREVPAVLGDLKIALAGMTEEARAGALQHIFPDAQARAGAMTIMDQLDAVNAAIEMNKTQVGSAASAYEKMSATANSQMALLKNAFTSALATIGAEILPQITPIISELAQNLPGAFATARAALQPFIDDMGPKLSAAFAILKDGATTAIQVFQGDWAPGLSSAGEAINPLVEGIGNLAIFIRDQAIPAVQQLASMVGPALGFIAANMGTIGPIVAGVAASFLVFTTVVAPIMAVGSAIAGMVATFTGAAAGLSGASAVIAGIVAVLGGPVTIAVVAVVAAIGLLTAAWAGNWGDIQGKTAAAWAFIQPILSGIGDAISTAWSVAQPALAALGEGLGQIGAAFDSGGLSGALDALSGLLTAGLNAAAAAAMAALAPLGEGIGAFFSGIGTTIQGALTTIGTTIQSGFTAAGATAVAATTALQAGVTAIWNLIPADIQADLVLIGTILVTRFAGFVTEALAWGQGMLTSIQGAWTTITTNTSTAWNAVSTVITAGVDAILTTVTGWVANVVAEIARLGGLALEGAQIVGDNILKPITDKIGEVLGAIGVWVGEFLGYLTGMADEVGAEGAHIGQSMVDGIGNAITGGLAWVGEQAANLARSATHAALEALGNPHSPSPVFVKIGATIPEGLGVGIAGGIGIVTEAVNRLTGAVTQTTTPLLARGGKTAAAAFIEALAQDLGASDARVGAAARVVFEAVAKSGIDIRAAIKNAGKFVGGDYINALAEELGANDEVVGNAVRDVLRAAVAGGIDLRQDVTGFTQSVTNLIVPSMSAAGTRGGQALSTAFQGAVVARPAGITDVMQTIIDTAIRHQIDPLIALALAKAESDFNPSAVGDRGASVGLFQLHERGQGAGMSKEQRSDPSVNAEKFLGAHGELFAQLKATGLVGDQLAATFGRLAEGSDPQFAQRYAAAYRDLAAQFGNANLAASGSIGTYTALGRVQADDGKWAAEMARQQAGLSQVLAGQAPAMRGTVDAMTGFRDVLGPIERQVAGGAISMETLRFKLVDLARATGLATKPWADYDAGLIDIDEAMMRVVNQSADAGPQFDALRQALGTTNTITNEGTLQFLQLALNIGKVAPAVSAVTGATQLNAGATDAAAGAAGEATDAVSSLASKHADLRPKIEASTQATKDFQSAVDSLSGSKFDEMADGWGKVSDAQNNARDSLRDYISEWQSAQQEGVDLSTFDVGGVVPGPLGMPRMILAHGGEEVLTLGQRRAARGGNLGGSGVVVQDDHRQINFIGIDRSNAAAMLAEHDRQERLRASRGGR